jgi:hypothetical protein
LLRGGKEAGGKMPLGFREPGDDSFRNLEAETPKEGVGEEVEGVSSEPGLATKLFPVVVKEEGMGTRSVHGPSHRPVVPGGERGELVAAAFVDGLGDSEEKTHVNVTVDQKLVRRLEDPVGELIKIRPGNWVGNGERARSGLI